MKAPKEDPEARRQREREMRVSAAERRRAGQTSAASMTTDFSSVYGARSLFSGMPQSR